MDVELLKEAISNLIENIPIGLHGKTISQGSQGLIPKEQQVKVLHILVDELDVNMTKLLITDLYASKTAADHKFSLHIWMRLIQEMDVVIDTKGQQKWTSYVHARILGSLANWSK